jgi:tetratricopeptide (TPR) repeat protein
MSSLQTAIRATTPAGLLTTRGVSKNLEARLQHCSGVPFEEAEAAAVELSAEAELPEAQLEGLEALAFLLLAHPQLEVNLGWDLQDLCAEVGERRGELAGPEAELSWLRLAMAQRPHEQALKVLFEHRRQHHKVTGERVAELRGYADSWSRRGKHERAVRCLEEALRLQPWRTEIPTLIARLSNARRERRWGVVKALGMVAAVALLLMGGLSVWSMDQRVHVRYSGLPDVDHEDLESLRRRHASLLNLQGRFPVWTGALKVRREILELELIEEQHTWREKQQAVERARAELLDDHRAVSLREQALWHLEAGDWDAAEDLLERALRTASENWELRSRVERDLEEVRSGPDQGR